MEFEIFIYFENVHQLILQSRKTINKCIILSELSGQWDIDLKDFSVSIYIFY